MLPAGKGDRPAGGPDIHTSCGDSHVLQGVSLQENRSQVVGILGRSDMGETSPDFLLMDEPTEKLARLLVREVGRVIGNLKARGPSILLVEQSIAPALRVTDQARTRTLGGTP